MSTNPDIDYDVITHWGVKYSWGIRWDPGYGSGHYFPSTEYEARAEAKRNGCELVTRTETIIVITTSWETVHDNA